MKISNYSIPPAYSLLEDPKFSSCKQLSLIRDEQQCGCWAFVVAEVVSDRFCVSSKTKVNEVLSPQYLISCDSNNGGCSYGYFDTAFQFVENQGIGKLKNLKFSHELVSQSLKIAFHSFQVKGTTFPLVQKSVSPIILSPSSRSTTPVPSFHRTSKECN